MRGRGISVRRGGTEILSGVDFLARPGEFVAVLGPSGSGKTTLLYALAGFRPADRGTVTLSGRDVSEEFEGLKARIGFVPQDDVVPVALRVERVLQYAAELRLPDLAASERQARVERVMGDLGLTERRTLRVSKLSGGQRKRVSVAVELLGDPDVLFADEPTSGLDPALERSLTELLRRRADAGQTVVVTTHIMSSLSLFDRLAVLVAGQLVFFGPPATIKAYFKVDELTEIYHRLANEAAKTWRKRFTDSGLRTRFLGS